MVEMLDQFESRVIRNPSLPSSRRKPACVERKTLPLKLTAEFATDVMAKRESVMTVMATTISIMPKPRAGCRPARLSFCSAKILASE